MTPIVTYRLDIERVALAYRLDPHLVAALIDKESGGNPWAWNPEPRYRYLWNVRTRAPFRPLTSAEAQAETPPADFPTLAGDPDQEWWGQQASWGLMQVMGAVAREHGFTGSYLTRLCDPVTNLEAGCQHLASLVASMRRMYTGLASQAENVVRVSALAAYNGGPSGNGPNGVVRNRAYALDVLDRYRRITSANA